MTPQEKAKELMEKMQVIHYTKLSSKPEHKGIPVSMRDDQVKQCALICVAEIYRLNLKIGQYLDDFEDKEMYYSYWEEVKQEIEKL